MNNNKTFFYFSIILLVLIPIILFCIIRKIKDKKFYKWYYENIPIDMFMSNNVNFFLQTGKYYSNFFDFRNVQNWGNDLNNGMQQLITNLKNTVLIKSNNPNCYKEVITSKGTIREIPIGR